MGGTEDDDEATALSLPFERASVAVARILLTEALRAADVSPLAVEDARLVLSELALNAVEHGRPDSEGKFQVSWRIGPDVVAIAVTDAGTRGILRPLSPDAGAPRGRGLAIVDSLCQSWEVARDNGTQILACLELETSAPTS